LFWLDRKKKEGKNKGKPKRCSEGVESYFGAETISGG
jgi:hypothetical protein